MEREEVKSNEVNVKKSKPEEKLKKSQRPYKPYSVSIGRILIEKAKAGDQNAQHVANTLFSYSRKVRKNDKRATNHRGQRSNNNKYQGKQNKRTNNRRSKNQWDKKD